MPGRVFVDTNILFDPYDSLTLLSSVDPDKDDIKALLVVLVKYRFLARESNAVLVRRIA